MKIAVLQNAGDEKAAQLARRLSLPLVVEASEALYVLMYLENGQGLALQQTGKKAPGPVQVDFDSAASTYRRTKGGGELLVKAVGGDKQSRPTVFDATAGLGRDSFVLASWGYPVTLSERSSVIAELLQDGLERGLQSEDPDIVEAVSRMQLKPGDSQAFLQQANRSSLPDVIYLDPMFPSSKKSALVKKEMQAFHHVVGKEADDIDELIAAALDHAVYRVVVKRPLKAEVLAGKKPSYSLKGKAVRFDVYVLKAYA